MADQSRLLQLGRTPLRRCARSMSRMKTSERFSEPRTCTDCFDERSSALLEYAHMEQQPRDRQERDPCDQCRRRKVRCNYATPCDKCAAYGLECTRLSIRKKRGPKQGRGKVLQQLRAQQTGSAVNSPGHADTASEPPSSSPHQWQHGQSDSRVRFDSRPPVAGPVHELQVQQHASTPVVSGPEAWTQPLPPDSLNMDDSYFTFDEFAHSILASGFANPADQQTGDQGTNLPDINTLLNHATPQSVPVISPFEFSTAGTPHTAHATISAGTGRTELESTPLVERAISLFFSHLYPIYPMVDEARVRRSLRELTSASEQSAVEERQNSNPNFKLSETTLIWSICAMSLTMVDNWPALSFEQRNVSARRFVKQILIVRAEAVDYMESPSHADVLTSLFVAVTWFELKRRTTSSFYNRESITLAFAARLHKHLDEIDEAEVVRCKRTLALLYITERGAAVLHGFPVTIFRAPPMPTDVLPGEDPSIAPGLTSLHSLFALLDDKFVRLWNEQSYDAFADRGLADLSLLQEHLRVPLNMDKVSEIQKADILITQQWLRLIFWQAGLRQGLISTTSQDPAFSYTYPIDIAMSLCEIVKTLPPVAIQVHGLGIFEKQFEISYSLMDALTLSGISRPEHQECLRYLLLSLSASPNSRQVYVKTLEKKMDGGTQKYRNLAGVQLMIEDDNLRTRSRRSSRVDGSAMD